MSVADSRTVGTTERPRDNADDRYSFVHWCAIGGQLGLFVALLYQFNLESQAFLRLALLTSFGWLVHYFLPRRYRLLFFVLLSFAGIELVFGKMWDKWWYGGLIEGAWIITIGLGLIGLCHLPLSLAWRAMLLLAAGGVLAVARVGWVSVPWSEAIWPVLASMFMFRLIVYLYELRHEKRPVTLLERLAYFFMLPNVCFPLFPVVDFQTFRRTYYDHADRHYIYQTGIHWLFRGAFHLILYRLVYQNFVIDAAEVENRTDLVQFLLWPFLLYLRVSGTFHIITGLLHLFGFNLPETHKLYFLSSSFTDFWRRINIYWKDFIMKIFYYPLYFRLRRWNETGALVLATLVAFLVTWFLHNYQWFWLRGTWIFTWNDFLFWMILAVLVAGNALYEMRRGRTRRLAGRALTWRQALVIALQTVGVFATISLLWSFWSASSVGQWFAILGAAGPPSATEASPLLVLAIVALIIAIPAVALARGAADRPFRFNRSVASVAIPATLALALSFPEVHGLAGELARETMASIKNSELNRRDFANFERGYYENLTDVGGFNPELWMVYAAKPGDWGFIRDTPLTQHTTTFLEFELRPLAEGTFHGALVRTNRWGMRDQDYEKAHPPNTLRIALLGASHVFGEGVGNEETFEAVLEERLNREAEDVGDVHYEILNFGVGNYGPLDCLTVLEDKVFEFQPDFIFYVEHTRAAERNLADVARALDNGTAVRYDFLQELADKAEMGNGVNRDVLRSFKERILRAAYSRLVSSTRKRNVPIVWVYLPRADAPLLEDSPESDLRLAQETGFTILDLTGVYDGHDLESLWVAPWDHHPNATGHRLIADKLYEVLRQNADKIPLGLASSASMRPSEGIGLQ